MPLKLVTADTFRDAAKSGTVMDALLLRSNSDPAESISEESRTASFIFSDERIDLQGDIISAPGWDTSDFNERNAPALWAHASWDPPIGRASNVVVRNKKQLVGDITFASADVYPFADTIYKLVKGGFLNAVSVGFVPLEWEFSKEKSRQGGINFLRQKLIEISVCACPANQNALIEARSVGIDTGPVMVWAEKLLDGEGRISVPRKLLEDTFRAAKTPKSVRQKYLIPSERSADMETWKCAAVSGLPIGESDAWDGKAAADHIFATAGFDGDSPDTEMARSAFLAYDSAAPTLRASYKLPFCDVVDGELKAMPGGIRRAGESMEGGADIADDVQAAARNVMDGYEARIAEAAEVAVTTKIGAAVSAARKAMLQEAKGHHQSAMDCMAKATACVEKAMGADDEPDTGDMPHDPMMDGHVDGKMDVGNIGADALAEAVEKAANDAESEVEAAAAAATEAAEVARLQRARLARARQIQAQAALGAD